MSVWKVAGIAAVVAYVLILINNRFPLPPAPKNPAAAVGGQK